jgi:negative regulator of replication initiation
VHRTQIYLQNDLHESLKMRARSIGVSMSELIRRTLEKGVQKDPIADARAFFERLTPLESFAQVDAEAYVRRIRGNSRILRKSDAL